MTTRLKGNCYLLVVVVEVEVLCWIDHRSTDRGVSRIPLVKQEATRSKKLEDQESNQESVDPGSDPGTSQAGGCEKYSNNRSPSSNTICHDHVVNDSYDNLFLFGFPSTRKFVTEIFFKSSTLSEL